MESLKEEYISGIGCAAFIDTLVFRSAADDEAAHRIPGLMRCADRLFITFASNNCGSGGRDEATAGSG